MAITERFLRYVRVDTQSDEYSETSPTTEKQLHLSRLLAEELRAVGCPDAACDRFGYVYAHLPAAPGHEQAPVLGLIAHVDTAPDFSGSEVSPRVIPDYDGGDVELGGGLWLRCAAFPHLPSLKGRTLITTDGKTLLGADDKAGIAEIMDAVERVQREGLPHGELAIVFTPDEEVGEGTRHFDLERCGAAFAYTVDGGPEGEIVYENFYAAQATVEFSGFNVHPGSAKGRMINAAQVAMEFNALLPTADRPEYTEGYEGFFHLLHMQGDTAAARLVYLIRDHDAHRFAFRKETLTHCVDCLNTRYGEGTVTMTLRDQYPNMAEVISRPENRHLIDHAEAAIRSVGLTPITQPIRGGTDGATLSVRGLPCPNLGTGGYAAHGPYEHCTVEGMQLCSDILVSLIQSYAE